MNSKLLLAGMLLSASAAQASDNAIPDICKTAANYTAQTLNMHYEDGTFTDGVVNPSHIRLQRDFNKFPITKVTFLGNCDEDGSKLKDSWCQVAGGSPNVYQVDVGQNDGKQTWPLATVIVTYNRGGCWVDEASK